MGVGLTRGTSDDGETLAAFLDFLMLPMETEEFEDVLARVAPASRQRISGMLTPIGSTMSAAPNLPDLVSHLGPARIAQGAPPEVRPGTVADVVGTSIVPGGTGGREIGPNGRYTVKVDDGSTTDVEERFVERHNPAT